MVNGKERRWKREGNESERERGRNRRRGMTA